MSVFTLLSYINKVSLLAFFITTLVVGYQIYILRKEKNKEQTPSIPDFKEGNSFNMVANFTSLPSSLLKKETTIANYSKPVFLVISLLTIIVVIFVVSLIGKNNSSNNQALVTPSPFPSPTPKKEILSPTPVVIEPTIESSASPSIDSTVDSSNVESSASPTIEPEPEASPTEIVVAVAPTDEQSQNPTEETPAPTVLPETGSFEKGLLIIGVAISTIFFSFWF